MLLEGQKSHVNICWDKDISLEFELAFGFSYFQENLPRSINVD